MLNGPVWLGTNKVVHTDAGTWVLGNASNVFSVLELDQTSTVRIAVNNAVPTNALIQFDALNPRFDMSNFNQTVVGMVGTGVVRTGTAAVGGVLTINDQGRTNVFPGSIIENGSLVKTGPGMFTLLPPSPNTYTGGTTVAGGVLRLSYSQTGFNLGTIRGPLTINPGATVQATVEKALGFASSASGNVTVVTINGGLLDFTGVNGLGGGQTYLMTGGAIQSNGGTNSATAAGYLRFAAGGPDPTVYTLATNVSCTISGRIQMDTTGTFSTAQGTVSGGPDLLVGAAVTGSNNFTKAGAGTMRMDAGSPFNASAIISGGTLALGSGGVLSNATVIVGAGTLFDVTAPAATFGSYVLRPLSALEGSGSVTGALSTLAGARIFPGLPGVAAAQPRPGGKLAGLCAVSRPGRLFLGRA